jgi:hyperosmotically inducible protein
MKGIVLAVMVMAIAWAPAAALAQQSGGTSSGGFGTTMKDSWLTTKAKSRLLADKRVKSLGIEVETRNGVVVLRGKVRAPGERAAAEEVARGTDGVRSVANLLQVVPEALRKAVDARDEEIKRAVMLRLEGDNSLKRVSVRSDAAMVTLMGTVADAGAQKRASDAARGVPGVKMVRNEIKVKSAQAAKAR